MPKPASDSPDRFPAFKEWQVIVGALAAGEQILILRKGGIAEGRRGFDPARAARFWLFPTHFHAQHEKTKPAAAIWFSPADDPAPPATVTLRCFAEVVQTAFFDHWNDVARLDPFHFWTGSTIREKFDWSRPPGLHALVVRVRRLVQPVTLPVTPDMAGCKSWIELPVPFDPRTSVPALDDQTFSARLAALGLWELFGK